MGFILGGLDSESYDRTYSDRELLRRIASYFRAEWQRMLQKLKGEVGEEGKD